MFSACWHRFSCVNVNIAGILNHRFMGIWLSLWAVLLDQKISCYCEKKCFIERFERLHWRISPITNYTLQTQSSAHDDWTGVKTKIKRTGTAVLWAHFKFISCFHKRKMEWERACYWKKCQKRGLTETKENEGNTTKSKNTRLSGTINLPTALEFAQRQSALNLIGVRMCVCVAVCLCTLWNVVTFRCFASHGP